MFIQHMYDLITIGDIKLDTFVVLPKRSAQVKLMKDTRREWLCTEYRAKISVTDFAPQIAGSAPNVAVGGARLALKTAIISSVGTDSIGTLAVEHLSRERVDTRHLTKMKDVRSSYSIVTMYREDRTILAALQPHTFRMPKTCATKWLFVSEMGPGFEPLFKDIVTRCKNKQIRLGFNPGALQLKAGLAALKPILKATSILFVNTDEAAQLLNHRNRQSDITHLLTALWKLGPSTVVVTDGPRGAYAFDGGKPLFMPAFPGKATERTGAGDAFACGFLAATIHGKSAAEALRWASANSASVVRHVGPQPGLLAHTAMRETLRKHHRIQAKEL
ncbi:MAG: PfkB family carbohydrate kinase [Candidatus Uhrbacteria bacterium]